MLAQALLSWIETWLIARISFIGRVGIATVHKEYGLLRSGWKTFLLLFSIQVVIIIALAIVQKRLPQKMALVVTSALLFLGAIGLFVTYQDFLHTYTHRILKEHFHLGFYLFWLGWIGTCLFFITQLTKKRPKTSFPLDPNIPDTISDRI